MEDPPPEGPDPARASKRGLLRALIKAPDSYGLLFIVLIVDYVLLTIDWSDRWALVGRTIWLCLTSLLAFWTSRVPRRIMVAVAVACGLTFITSVVVALQGQMVADGAVFILAAALVLSAPIAIGWRSFKHETVTGETIMGALCIYVLIGMIFATLDYGIQLISGTYFAQPGPHLVSDFVYFSYITMATVGYGDLTPAPGLPRTTSALEALIGQIFLVVLVARLVSMYSPTFMRRAEIRRQMEVDQEARAERR
jgi:voltage-gated potassium channel